VPTARWEHGSDLPLSVDVGPADLPWTARPHSLWGSGLDAMRALARWGTDRHGWRSLLVPTYYCQDILPTLADDIDLGVYERGPLDRRPASVRAAQGEVVVAAALFGGPTGVRGGPATVIEDHSHDPSSPRAHRSRAAYAVASLRKALPLPDGGVLWSPQGLPVPDGIGPTEAHGRAVLLRLQAMTLKHAYLQGADVPKDAFRRLYAEGEGALREGPISGISDYAKERLSILPTTRWRRARARNLRSFREALGPRRDVRVLDVPFAAVLVLDRPEIRGRIRRLLVEASIYPAILWPLDAPAVAGIPPEHLDLSRRILVLHADQRYTPHDMSRVGRAVSAALDAA
jgi:hypothetical protein